MFWFTIVILRDVMFALLSPKSVSLKKNGFGLRNLGLEFIHRLISLDVFSFRFRSTCQHVSFIATSFWNVLELFTFHTDSFNLRFLVLVPAKVALSFDVFSFCNSQMAADLNYITMHCSPHSDEAHQECVPRRLLIYTQRNENLLFERSRKNMEKICCVFEISRKNMERIWTYSLRWLRMVWSGKEMEGIWPNSGWDQEGICVVSC